MPLSSLSCLARQLEGCGMGFAYNFRGILKPTVVGASFLASLSVAFALACTLIDYQTYLKAYQASQAQEVEALKEKVDATLGSIKKLLCLTEARIQAAYGNLGPSRGTANKDHQELIQRIERILASLHHLPFQTLPELLIVFYNKLSPPYMAISRFGALPLDPGKVTLENVLRDNREPLLIFGDKAIKGKVPVLNPQNSLEGMLEIQFDLEAFKRFLGPYRTIHFDQPNTVAILEAPFPAYAKPPDPFWTYVRIHQSHYAAFALYALFTLFFIGLYLFFLNRRIHKSYRHQFKNLKDALSKTGTAEKTLRTALGMRQQDTQIHLIPCQAQKKLQARLKQRQQERARHIISSLKAAQQSDAGKTEILDACIQEAKALSDGLWYSTRRENIDFKGILDNIQLIFAEKIHQSGITVKTTVACEGAPFLGDPLLMEVLLLNAVGKPLHRVPKDGVLSVSLKEIPGFLHLEVRDNGYAGVEAAEKMIQKSCGFFMDEETFYRACSGQEITCQSAKIQGFNITQMMIAIPEEEISTNNVVQLFP